MIDHIRTAIIGDTDINAEIAGRFDPFVRVESGSDALPACMYEVTNDEPLAVIGTASLKQSTVEITTISQQLSKSDEVAELIVEFLDGYSDTSNGIQRCKHTGTERQELEPFDGSENYFFLTTTIWEIWHDYT